MLKPGVDIRGLHSQMVLAYSVACAVYARYGVSQCVITSASDGKHGPNSLHYKGKALDLRTSNVPTAILHLVHRGLKDSLGAQFDVVLESDHIHVEFDPKEPDPPQEA
jgi:hypothetical protein